MGSTSNPNPSPNPNPNPKQVSACEHGLDLEMPGLNKGRAATLHLTLTPHPSPRTPSPHAYPTLTPTLTLTLTLTLSLTRARRQAGGRSAGGAAGRAGAAHRGLCLPYTSRTSPLHLLYISPAGAAHRSSARDLSHPRSPAQPAREAPRSRGRADGPPPLRLGLGLRLGQG